MSSLESGLVVLVPAAEKLVEPFRTRYDPSAAAGMPAHVTLLYPFKPPGEIGEVDIEMLDRCLASFRRFDFALTTIRRFSNGALYLAPEPDEPFRQITLAIWGCYPETPPYGGRFSTIVPHLTIVEPGEGCEIERIAAEFAAAGDRTLPIRATASEIALMDTLTGSWQVRTTIPLG